LLVVLVELENDAGYFRVLNRRKSETYEELVVLGRLHGSILRKRLDDFCGFFELAFSKTFRHGSEVEKGKDGR
jgi:hypothetical protein